MPAFCQLYVMHVYGGMAVQEGQIRLLFLSVQGLIYEIIITISINFTI